MPEDIQILQPTDLVVFTDGACSGNPGPGGWAYLVYDFDKVHEGAQQELATTNNRMELLALIKAFQLILKLKKLTDKTDLKIYTDSVYVIRGATQWLWGWKKRGWKTAENAAVSNQDLWMDMDQCLYKIKSTFPDVKLTWNYVRGHTGVLGNEICDKLSVKASKGEYLNLYTGPLKNYSVEIAILPPQGELPEMKKKGPSGPAKKEWYISYVNGVYSRHETWAECERVVKGRPAQFKKVSSAEEEDALKLKWGV